MPTRSAEWLIWPLRGEEGSLSLAEGVGSGSQIALPTGRWPGLGRGLATGDVRQGAWRVQPEVGGATTSGRPPGAAG